MLMSQRDRGRYWAWGLGRGQGPAAWSPSLLGFRSTSELRTRTYIFQISFIFRAVMGSQQN